LSELSFLFWNTRQLQDREILLQLAIDKSLDVICIAESGFEPMPTADALSVRTGKQFMNCPVTGQKLQLFARSEVGMKEVYGIVGNGRMTIQEFTFANEKYLLGITHGASKVNWSDQDQFAEACVLSDIIREVEEKRHNERTILCGDFNMDPFHEGLIAAKAFHAMSTAESVMSGSRAIQSRKYSFFYNPMWSFFGDRTTGPAGTHYYRHSGHVSYDWHMYDQVLLRPSCIKLLRDIQIVVEVNGIKLCGKNGRPDTRFSDHFPIWFALEK
jgi:hypothetical protein